MHKEALLKTAFVISTIGVIAGVLFKIMHRPGADIFLTTGYAATGIFVILCLYEILSSRKINGPEKLMWTVGLLFITTITGLLYFMNGRKRVL